jgi:hypothetical protein
LSRVSAATLLEEGFATQASIYRGFGGQRNRMLYSWCAGAGGASDTAADGLAPRPMMELEINPGAPKLHGEGLQQAGGGWSWNIE